MMVLSLQNSFLSRSNLSAILTLLSSFNIFIKRHLPIMWFFTLRKQSFLHERQSLCSLTTFFLSRTLKRQKFMSRLLASISVECLRILPHNEISVHAFRTWSHILFQLLAFFGRDNIRIYSLESTLLVAIQIRQIRGFIRGHRHTLTDSFIYSTALVENLHSACLCSNRRLACFNCRRLV